METIRINVEVNVNLSESTQNFILSLFGKAAAQKPAPAPVAEEAPAQAFDDMPAPVPAKRRTKAAAQKPAPAPVAEEAPAQAFDDMPAEIMGEVPAPAKKLDINEVRRVLAEKVNDHRSEIKQKLMELGAPSLTKLDPAMYGELYRFLLAL